MAAFFWLSAKTGWPQAYGYSCAGNGCLIFDAWHSPARLRQPTVYSVALFGWYWTMISAAVLLVLRAAAKRPRNVQIRAAAFFIIGIILSIVVHGWGSN